MELQTTRSFQNIYYPEKMLKVFYNQTRMHLQLLKQELLLALEVLHLKLDDIVPCVSGPKRPHDQVLLKNLQTDFRNCLKKQETPPKMSF